MANKSGASRGEFGSALEAIREWLVAGEPDGSAINLAFIDGPRQDVQVDVRVQGGLELRGSKTANTDDVPTYKPAPTNYLANLQQDGFALWTTTGVSDTIGSEESFETKPDTSAPILAVYVEPNPEKLQWTHLHAYDWFSPTQYTQ